MTTLYMTMLIFVVMASSLLSQTTYRYAVSIDTALNLTTYKDSTGHYNVSAITSWLDSAETTGNRRLRQFARLVSDMQAVSLRKILRKLHDSVLVEMADSTPISFELLQRVFIIERNNALDSTTAERILDSNDIATGIELVGNAQTMAVWPPNDLLWPGQVELYDPSIYNINLPRAWRFSAGNAGIKVGIIDNGVQSSHPDLGNGFGAGYRIRGGYDFFDNDNSPEPTSSPEHHGTPIAGIIGALNNNNMGVVGIAGGRGGVETGVQLFSFRVGSNNDFDGPNILEAVYKSAKDYGIHILNCSFVSRSSVSWGWELPFMESKYTIYRYAYLKNVVAVTARGNDNNTNALFPCHFSTKGIVISVSGIDPTTGNRQNNGNYSSYGDSVTIGAPYTSAQTTQNIWSSTDPGYDFFNGTSNAAPMVSGTAALILSKFLERSITCYAEDVREILKIGANKTGISNGYSQDLGFGRLDAGQTLYYCNNPFTLEHHLAENDRSVATVAYGSGIGTIIVPGHPGFKDILEVKRVRATFHVPDKFTDPDSLWVWSNRNTQGYLYVSGANGFIGDIPEAKFISHSGRDWTFETYCFRYTEGWTDVWYPSNPANTQIGISILGKDNACQETLSLQDYITPVNTVENYHAKVRITAGPDFRIVDPAEVSFVAGQEIVLRAGFSAESGSNFHAYINPGIDCVVPDQCLIQRSSPVSRITPQMATEYTLAVYPNPTTGRTVVSYTVPASGPVHIVVTDVFGRTVTELVKDDSHVQGRFSIVFDAGTIPTGTYYIALRAGEALKTQRVTIVR